MRASAVLVLNLAARAAPIEGSGDSLAEAVMVDEGGSLTVADEAATSLSARVSALEGYLDELAETRGAAEAPTDPEVLAALKEKMSVYPGMKSIQQLMDWTPETA